MVPGRSKEELPDIKRTPANVPTYKIRIHALQAGGREYSPRHNAVAETGRETLYLVFQPS